MTCLTPRHASVLALGLLLACAPMQAARAQTAATAPSTSATATDPPITTAPAVATTAPGTTDSAPPAGTRAPRWYLQTSVATRHFNPDPAHVNNQQLLNIEHITRTEFVYGFAAFKNSFGQPTEFLYVGQRWHPLERHPELHVKLTAGLLHGYRGEYRDKIPFNKAGTAPVLLPAVGYSYKRFASELVMFGNSGVMLTLGYYLN